MELAGPLLEVLKEALSEVPPLYIFAAVMVLQVVIFLAVMYKWYFHVHGPKTYIEISHAPLQQNIPGVTSPMYTRAPQSRSRGASSAASTNRGGSVSSASSASSASVAQRGGKPQVTTGARSPSGSSSSHGGSIDKGLHHDEGATSSGSSSAASKGGGGGKKGESKQPDFLSWDEAELRRRSVKGSREEEFAEVISMVKNMKECMDGESAE